MNATVVSEQQNTGGPRYESQSVLVHMHRTCSAAVGIAARGIVPHRPGACCEPDVKRADKDAVRIIGVHRYCLVVPVLRVIALAIGAVPQ